MGSRAAGGDTVVGEGLVPLVLDEVPEGLHGGWRLTSRNSCTFEPT